MPVTNFPDGVNVEAGELQIAGVAVTATAAEINAIAGGGLSATELGYLDGVTAGTAVASKAAVLGASKQIDTIDVTLLKVGAVDKTNVAIGAAAGYKVARGETALDASNPTPVATGLTTVVAFSATLKGTAAPGVGTSVLTAVISGTDVNVYAWKVTSSADTTLVASTGTESFYWVAVGT